MVLRVSTSERSSLRPHYNVIGPAYIHDLAIGQALHGPIPSGSEAFLSTRNFRDTVVSHWLWFRDVTTGQVFPVDPRLEEIPEEWRLGRNFREGEREWYVHTKTGKISWEPCNELDELKKRGVDIRDIVLV